jgi:hypothetical protein
MGDGRLRLSFDAFHDSRCGRMGCKECRGPDHDRGAIPRCLGLAFCKLQKSRGCAGKWLI